MLGHAYLEKGNTFRYEQYLLLSHKPNVWYQLRKKQWQFMGENDIMIVFMRTGKEGYEKEDDVLAWTYPM